MSKRVGARSINPKGFFYFSARQTSGNPQQWTLRSVPHVRQAGDGSPTVIKKFFAVISSHGECALVQQFKSASELARRSICRSAQRTP